MHDCEVHNDDDSVAVKPTNFGTEFIDGTRTNCTERVLVEDTVLTGFGASIGSVGPTTAWPCVDSATFRNVAMVTQPSDGAAARETATREGTADGRSAAKRRPLEAGTTALLGLG